MAWSWSALSGDEFVSHGEVVDAVNQGQLQWSAFGPPSSVPDHGICYSREDFENYIESTDMSGSGILNNELMTKDDMIQYRDLADPITITPDDFSVELSAIDDSWVLITWNNPGSASTSWDFQIARCQGTSCTPTMVIFQDSVSGTSQSRTDSGTSSLTTYRYRMRYVSGSEEGPWTSTLQITTGEGEDPT